MPAFKEPDFNQRTSAARDARMEALEKLRNKPAPDPAAVAARQAARESREAAEAERRAARQSAADEAKAAKAAKAAEAAEAAAAAAAEALANAVPEKAPMTDEERKAARDARYAARKARKR